jgi:hypothetical protein
MEKWLILILGVLVIGMVIYYKAVKKRNHCKVIQSGKEEYVIHEKETEIAPGYTLMIAPFDFARHHKIAAQQFFDNYAFFELIPKKADEYFLWFQKEIPGRIALLWEYMKKERPETQPFDYSPESLIPLWDWYETKIKQVPKSKKEIDYEVSRYPKWMEENVRKITMKFTDETLSLALDIAIYLGETIIKNYPNLYWGHFSRPKRELFVNKPVILKLKSKRMYFAPTGTVFVCMIKSSKNRDKNRLYDLYRYNEDEFDPVKPSYWDSW